MESIVSVLLSVRCTEQYLYRYLVFSTAKYPTNRHISKTPWTAAVADSRFRLWLSSWVVHNVYHHTVRHTLSMLWPYSKFRPFQTRLFCASMVSGSLHPVTLWQQSRRWIYNFESRWCTQTAPPSRILHVYTITFCNIRGVSGRLSPVTTKSADLARG